MNGSQGKNLDLGGIDPFCWEHTSFPISSPFLGLESCSWFVVGRTCGRVCIPLSVYTQKTIKNIVGQFLNDSPLSHIASWISRPNIHNKLQWYSFNFYHFILNSFNKLPAKLNSKPKKMKFPPSKKKTHVSPKKTCLWKIKTNKKSPTEDSTEKTTSQKNANLEAFQKSKLCLWSLPFGNMEKLNCCWQPSPENYPPVN